MESNVNVLHYIAVREEVSFANVLTACDELDAPLNVGWSTAKILYTARMDVLSQVRSIG